MRLVVGILLLLGVASCSSDEANVIVQEVQINGSWTPYKYEYRGKDVQLNDCDRKGQLVINADFSGVYERYAIVEPTGNCNKVESYPGKWSYDKMNHILTLTYTEAGTSKTLVKEVDTFSETELRISDNSKNLDNVPGNDEGILVFRKG
ncbi:lipocalin family protein [Chryseobacterium indologenes]|uniref:lipocalin family protein n=1 Tax=Chryseobacterium indologenes TaxID=253 RepID=UPI0023E8980F|nr:lipocalin family protein [Chryseobacterium indologenes]WET47379.1 lipocalin family protein [Chryseobacterium indologenes]